MPTEVDSRSQADNFVLIQIDVPRCLDRKQVRPEFCGQRFSKLACISVVNGCIHNCDGRLRGHEEAL